MISQIVLDFETRSPCDLRARGIFPYAEDTLTEIMCLSVAINDQHPYLWVPQKFLSKINVSLLRYELITEPRLLQLIDRSEKIIAHNSMFEYKAWNQICKRDYGWPEIPLEKFYDTMAQCAMCALPLNLEDAGNAIGLSIKKDADGHKVMVKLCKPRNPRKAEKEQNPDWQNTIYWHEDPADLVKLFNYCGRDVETERLVYHALPQLPPTERKIWLMDQRINLRGVPIDVENVKAIVKVLDEYQEKQLARFQEITGGAVSGPRSYVAFKNWVNEQTGLQLDSINKNAAEELLNDGALPAHVKEAVQIKAELSKASTAKLRAMIECAGSDSRLRGMFQYHGAATGRWAGRKVQLHNQPRDSYKPAMWEWVSKLFRENDIEAIKIFCDSPYFAASRCVRGSICSMEDREIICSDFSSIEAVVNAWLSGDEKTLDLFRQGKKSYFAVAAGIFNKTYDEITKDSQEYMVGKVTDLSMGFLGGIGAFASMAKNYRLDLETLPPIILPTATSDELDGQWGAVSLAKSYVSRNSDNMSLEAAVACDVIKRRWREQHSAIVRFGKGLGEAAYKAVAEPGKVFACGRIKYVVYKGFLKCLLPSGRQIYYYNPQIRNVRKVWDDEDYEGDPSITYMGLRVVDGKTTRQFTRVATYAGKLLENAVSGTARDVLAWAMLRVEDKGYPIILHVHDEGGAELPKGVGSLEAFNKEFTKIPFWAKGMPIRCEGWVGRRYRK